MSPCSKSTTHHLIQVPCLHRGHHAGFPPFLHPSPSIFSIFPPLFPPCSIITVPSLPPHRPSPPAALVHSSLSFPFPFLFFFFSLSAPAPPLTRAVLPRSPCSSVPLPSPQFCCFFFFFFFGLGLQIIPHRRSLRPTLLHTRTTLDIHRKCRTKEMQRRKDRQS
jgi:hypothetical protein